MRSGNRIFTSGAQFEPLPERLERWDERDLLHVVAL